MQTPSDESTSVSKGFAPLCSIHSRCGVEGSGDQALYLSTMASILVHCVEARPKLDAPTAVFPRASAAVLFVLPLKPPAFSILIEIGNLCFPATFLFLCRPGLVFLQFIELFCSLLPGHSELYHYHLLWKHGPQTYIESQVCTCFMCVPRSTLLCRLLDSDKRLALAEVFVFVSHKADELRPCLVR